MTNRYYWKIAAASALGTSHAKLGTPCQDAHAVKVMPDSDGEDTLVVVVSDGAGSAARAEIGSRLTCSTIIEAVEVFLTNGGKVAEISVNEARSWIATIQQAIAIRAESDQSVSRDYACTMLVAVIGRNAAAIMQIGDGATVVSDEEGWCWVHWPQHGEFANTTYFVTDPEAKERLAFDLCSRQINEVALFTDGIERMVLHEATKTVFAPFFDRMFPAIRASGQKGSNQKLSEALESYLNSKVICDKTDDDKTLVLATRHAPTSMEPTPSSEGA